MAQAYAKEFEKWLENAQDKQSPSLEHIISNDDTDASDRQSLSPLGNLEMTYESGAPILSDDENDGNNYDGAAQSRIKNCFEDEPPILELVPSTHVVVCNKDKPLITTMAKMSDRSMTSNNYESNSKVECMLANSGVNIKKHGKTLESRSRSYQSNNNLFEKFSSITDQNDDVPPPLIPSPTASLMIDKSDSGGSRVKLKPPNCSPDFRAMEADSTSEIHKNEGNDELSSTNQKGKVLDLTCSSNDLLIECDSTCMLGASPQVSSSFSSSVCVGDTDMDDDVGLTSASQMISMDVIDEEMLEKQDSLPLCHVEIDNEKSEYYNSANHNLNEVSQDCPSLEAVNFIEPKDIHDDEEIGDIVTEDPPVLSACVPEVISTLRRKRHTIDAVGNIDSFEGTTSFSSHKSTEEFNSTLTKPPKLSKEVGAVDLSLPENTGRRKLSKKKSKCIKKKDNSIAGGVRKRSYSMVDYSKFIKTMSELSVLQSKMHKLVSLLFPQIRSELKTINPESIHFESVLIDLVSLIMEPKSNGTKDVLSFTPNLSIKDELDSDSVSHLCGLDLQSKSVAYSIKDISCQSKPSCLPLDIDSNSQCFKIDHESSSSSEQSSKSRHSTSKSAPVFTLSEAPLDQMPVIPGLSKLSLTSSTMKAVTHQPSVMIRSNAHEALRLFSKLSCNVLQLLLPELTINLYHAIGHSYNDLLNLIDSTILLNWGT